MRSRTGFTVLECVVVAGIATTLLAVGALRLPALRPALLTFGAAHQVAAAARLARAQAIAGGAALRLIRSPDGALDVRSGGTSVRRWMLPPDVTVTGLPAAGLTFGPLGTAQNATLTVAVQGHVRRIIVNQRGRVRLG